MSRRHGPGNNTVGYGKPPSRTRFRKGQSGNPRGRPKKNEDDIDVIGILDEPLTATKNGKTKKISPFEAAMIALVKKALEKNNLGAALEFIRFCENDGIMAPISNIEHLRPYIVPDDITGEEYHQMWAKHGPPPWPGERSGLPWWEEEELKRDKR